MLNTRSTALECFLEAAQQHPDHLCCMQRLGRQPTSQALDARHLPRETSEKEWAGALDKTTPVTVRESSAGEAAGNAWRDSCQLSNPHSMVEALGVTPELAAFTVAASAQRNASKLPASLNSAKVLVDKADAGLIHGWHGMLSHE